MLAIVCNSYAAADYLEKYEQDGNVDPTHDLYAIATALGRPVRGQYLVICLEDTRYCEKHINYILKHHF